ncbi:MAG: hypothetical protein C4K48_12925 [Candidatus Thorarchaeota archaeon]|nr:MAG: hypothetical protein C4K48_12925 [Candidatus Thorarchaeota archaeon]
MARFHTRNVSRENLEDFVRLCVPADRADESSFKRGISLKADWVERMLAEKGCIGKLAYDGTKPVGMIQYLPCPDENVVKIACIFVPSDKHLRKGIGSALLKSLIDDVTTPVSCFRNMTVKALVTNAFDVPGTYTQHEFYRKKGFSATAEDPHLLCYPLRDGVTYTPPKERYTRRSEDREKALIFFDGTCPFSIRFVEKMVQLIREVSPSIPIQTINKLNQPEEVEKRGGRVPDCIVNQRPIRSGFFDAENFKREVREAL